MIGCLGEPRAAQDSDTVARAVAAVALAALAVIHIVDLPGTLGAIPLVGIGYFGIIVAATLVGGVIVVRSHWLAWSVAGGVAAGAMAGYVLTRSLPGGFLGDHSDVGNWKCPLGITALSVETVIILLAAGWGVWQLGSARWPHLSGSLHVLPSRAESPADQDSQLRPVQ